MPTRIARLLALCAVVPAVLLGLVVAAPAPASASTRVSTRYLLDHLRVASEHATGYVRSEFPLWVDADHDGCDTRREVLIAESTATLHIGAGCALVGGRWYSRYDGVSTLDPSGFDIDHLVPLAEAWQSGAWRWSTDTRRRYANDLGYAASLIAVTAHTNRQKGDREPQSWLPPRRSFDCRYVAWWVAVKWRWHLSVNGSEASYLRSELSSCGWPAVVKPRRPAIHLASSGTTVGTADTSGVGISAIYFDSPGSDTGSGSSLDAEWVRLHNVTSTARTMTGWTVSDASGHVYRFATFSLAAGDSVELHTGSGTDTAHDLYWGLGGYVWNNTGDTAALRNGAGSTVDTCAYSSSADPEAFC